jgi:phosphatidylglycerol lysyltransferase
VRKVEEQGIEARSFRPDEQPFDPANDPDGMLDGMRALSAEWLRHHTGGEKSFCMGRFDPAQLHALWLLVAWNPALKRVEAFTTWVPIWGRKGWALDLMRRRPDSVAGVPEFLIVRSVDVARAHGEAVLSLSLSALAQVDEPGAVPAGATPAPALPVGGAEPDRARAFLMKHLARFYDFENLFRWKKKVAPAFEDRYLVYADPLALPRVVLALVRAQSPGGLLSYLRRPPAA